MLQIIGFLVIIAFFVAYFSMMQNQTYWLWVEIITGIFFVSFFSFSGYIMPLWLRGSEGDIITRNAFRLIILGMISRATIIFFTKDSDDRVIELSRPIANITARAGLLLCASHALFHVEEFDPRALVFDCVVGGLLLVGDLAQFKKLSTTDGRFELCEKAKYRAAIDTVASTAIALIMLGFPDLTVQFLASYVPLNGVHKKLIKNFASEVLGLSVLSLAALCYKNPNDVASVLKAKLIVYVPVALTSCWYILTSETGSTNWGTVFVGIAALAFVANCIMAQTTKHNSDAAKARTD